MRRLFKQEQTPQLERGGADVPWKDEHAAELFAYERVWQRLIAQNALQWQSPSLGLAAQAFLLTTSLNARTAELPRLLVSGVGVVLAVMTMQLMAKHRYLLRLDRAKLEELEASIGLPNITLHHRGTALDQRIHASWVTKRSSVGIWQAGLLCLLLLNVTVFVLALTCPQVFS